MLRINPDDVFPARDLPGQAEKWGRVVEERIRAAEEGVLSNRQALAAQERAFSAALAQIIATTLAPPTYTETDTDARIYSSPSTYLYTNTAVVVPVGATSVELTLKGALTATNDIIDPSPQDVELQLIGFYGLFTDPADWAFSSTISFAYSTVDLPIGETQTTVAYGQATVPVVVGDTLFVGLASKIAALPIDVVSTGTAQTTVTGAIRFIYPTT